ncbi:MAG TPA: hypothetical protein VK756_02790 [Solirubrobacteraceae bacterium]|jgi:hypothetical protein|nr:hypothetical protein [Solirubrobacteraceae bacterium]
MRVSMPRIGQLTIGSGLCAATLALAAPAAAERTATRAEFAAINHYFVRTERTLQDRLAWVKVSTRGPFALADLSGPQVAAVVLRGSGHRWRAIDTISDEGLKCGLVPHAVIADLHLERYNDGPRPCEQ